ncbi:NAD(P)-dependent oxidoreductase [Paenibacillus assamensis]|uniref:NAD(P)-dependent oxidoreductase n=1 Tax=Paenibacillus assamensis TaxID=311244 RepID=UPI0004912DEA|nr:NAD(P)-dependent oxidoreductase [Paenibacillus assamensis]
MKKVAVLGMGTMGAPMARNLLEKGYEVIVYNRTIEKTAPLAALGASVARTPKHAAAEADVVISMVSDDTSIIHIYDGPDGILAGLRPGTYVIDSSTISPTLVMRLAEDCNAKEAIFLDAPVTGSKPAAEAGTLLFMVGGESAALEAVRPVFEAMGSRIVHMGATGNGSITKLAHNAIVGINNAALAEGFSIVAKTGVNPSAFLEVVQNGSAGSKAADLKGKKIVDGNFDNQFSLQLILKDLKLASVLTDSIQTPTPMLEAAKNMFQIGHASGYGEEDLSAVVKVYEQWLGHTVNKGHEPTSK